MSNGLKVDAIKSETRIARRILQQRIETKLQRSVRERLLRRTASYKFYATYCPEVAFRMNTLIESEVKLAEREIGLVYNPSVSKQQHLYLLHKRQVDMFMHTMLDANMCDELNDMMHDFLDILEEDVLYWRSVRRQLALVIREFNFMIENVMAKARRQDIRGMYTDKNELIDRIRPHNLVLPI